MYQFGEDVVGSASFHDFQTYRISEEEARVILSLAIAGSHHVTPTANTSGKRLKIAKLSLRDLPVLSNTDDARILQLITMQTRSSAWVL